MLRVAALLFSLISIVTPAYGERLLGHDLLALSHKDFPYEKASEFIGRDSPLGVLDWTFGSSLTQFIYVLDRAHPSYARIHLLDTVCVRNKNCGSYSVLSGYTVASLDQALRNRNKKILAFVKERSAAYRDIAVSRPTTTFLISPALEHNLSKEAFRNLADAVLEVWPSVKLVNNGMNFSGLERYRGAYLESHGKAPAAGADITSLDGMEITDINSTRWVNRTRGNLITFRWTRSYNCRNNGPFQDPRRRKSCPRDGLIEEVHHITDEVGPALRYAGNDCKTLAAFKDPSINKPLADDHGTGDVRANYPVIIGNFGEGHLKIINYNDKELVNFGHYGKFENGPQQRYYSKYPPGTGLGGYQIQKLAQALGEPYVYAKRGTKCFGPYIPGRRQGTYR